MRVTPDAHRWLIAAGVLLALFVLLTAWVRWRGVIPLDRRLFVAATERAANRSETLSAFYEFFGGLGSPIVAGLTVGAAFAIVLRNVGFGDALLVPAAAAISLVGGPLSHLVGSTDAARDVGQLMNGYPSGHALYVSATFGAIAWLGRRHARPEVAAVATILILLMGLARIGDRSHLLDEILGGYLLGGAWLCLVLAGRFTRADAAVRP